MSQPARHNVTLAGLIITFAGSVMFSTKAIIVKMAYVSTQVDALTLLTLRMIFSLPFYIVAAVLISSKQGNIQLTVRQWLFIVMLGLCGYYFSSMLDFTGLQYISAGLERLILFLYPTFVVLINTIFFRQKISGLQLLALALTYSGVALAYFGELIFNSRDENFLWGAFLIFLCSVTYSIYIAGSGRIIPVIGATKFTAYAMLVATIGIFIHFLLKGSYAALQTSFSLWTYGLLLAIVATVIPSFLISDGLKRIGANNVAIISSVGPVSTILQAHFILGEKIFAAQIAGTVLVIAGVLLIGWKRKIVDG